MSRSWLRLEATSLLIVACVAFSATACSRDSSPGVGEDGTSADKAEVTLSEDLAPAAKIFSLSGTASEMAWDEKRTALWLVDRADDSVSLVQVVDSSVVRRFNLTAAHQPTVTQHVRVSPDGSVWVSDGYQVSRVDPTTSTVRTVTLSLKVDGMDPDATERGNPWAGTWVSAITFDGAGSAILARLNVPKLQVLSTALNTTAWISLPSAGRRIADAVLTQAGLRWVSLEDNAARTAPPSVKLLTIPLPLGVMSPSVSSSVDAVLRDTMKGSNNPSLITVKGEVLAADSHAGTITHTRLDGSSRVIHMPRSEQEIDAPNGKAVTVAQVPAPVLALAFGANDVVWFISRADGVESLYRLN